MTGRKLCVASASLALLSHVVLSCSPGPSRWVEPRYRPAPLPPWEPPAEEEPLFDPTVLDGPWVGEEPDSAGGNEKSLDLGAGGAQNSSTEAPARATVRPPSSD